MEITVVKALYDYAGDKPGRLHFSAGDSVQVLHQQPSGWWDGIAHGKRGWFPSNYVTLPPSRTRIRLPDTVSFINDYIRDRLIFSQYYGWERRERRDGGVFFHNPLTGESVKEIPASPTLSTRSNSTTAEVDIPPTIPESLQASTSTPTRRRSSVSGPGWEMLRQQILNAINDLKLAQKDEYLVMSSRIVQSIHQMLAASNALEKDAMILKSNKMLKIHHRHVLKSLSQLVLTSKQAAGMFAPEDAVNKMHADANEVWLAVRHFTSIAEDTGIPLRVSDFTSSMSNQISIGHQSASSSKQQPQQASSDAVFEELTKTLDSTCNEIFGGLRRLRDVVYLKPLPAATLIEQTKDAVLQIGQFLSLLDEIDEESIHLVSSPYSPSPLVEPDQTAKFFQDFIGSKENLYQSIRQLVTSTTSATDSSIQSANIITSLDESVNFVHQTVTALVESIRRFVRGHSTKPSLSSVGSISPPPPIVDLTRTDSDISVEPRRALSMNIMNPEAQSQVKTTPPASMDRNQVFASAPTSPAVDRQSIIQSSMRRSTSMFGSPKLSKFFGEEIREEHMGGGQERRGRDQRPWYLGYESDPKDVLLTMEGNVKGATLPALIERITLHDEFDSNLMHSFLLTYRTFAKGVEVFRLLQERFMLEPPAQLTPDELTAWSERKLKPIRLRVINVFKSWLDAYFFSREDRGVLSMMREFVQNTVKEVMPAAAEQLIKLIEKRETMRNRMSIKRQTLVSPGAIPKGDPPAPILPKTFEKFRLIDIDPLEMARQLTILDSSLYDRIEDIEFVDKAWSNKENTKAAPNIRMMIRLSNQVTGWVAETILSEYDVKRRSSLMKYFIYVADRCRHLNNYNMLMAILAALNSSPIHRLKRTFDLLSNKTCVLLEELKVLMAPTHNFTNYRNKLRSASLPCVPFLGLYLTDLTFIEDGNLNHIKSLPHLINIDKRLKTAEKIREIRQYRSVPFNLIEVPEMQMFLAANLENSTTDTDALYEQSLILEPRESEDERIVRLLHETGFA